MSTAYKFQNPDGVYFTSTATIQWVDVFTRPVYADIIIESLGYCQVEKGLVIHAWCLMSSHLHLIISRRGKEPLEAIYAILKNSPLVRLLKPFKMNLPKAEGIGYLPCRQTGFGFSGKPEKTTQIIATIPDSFFREQQDNHPEELITNRFIDQKLDYIHNNPVSAGLVDEPEHYRYSSARDYAGGKGLLDITLIE